MQGFERVRYLCYHNYGKNIEFKDFNFNNLWLGVSIENQEQADKRIPVLLQIPAAVRWLSCEPLLGPIDLTKLTISDGFAHKDVLNRTITAIPEDANFHC